MAHHANLLVSTLCSEHRRMRARRRRTLDLLDAACGRVADLRRRLDVEDAELADVTEQLRRLGHHPPLEEETC